MIMTLEETEKDREREERVMIANRRKHSKYFWWNMLVIERPTTDWQLRWSCWQIVYFNEVETYGENQREGRRDRESFSRRLLMIPIRRRRGRKVSSWNKGEEKIRFKYRSSGKYRRRGKRNKSLVFLFFSYLINIRISITFDHQWQIDRHTV